jgi:hypothetical protein
MYNSSVYVDYTGWKLDVHMWASVPRFEIVGEGVAKHVQYLVIVTIKEGTSNGEGRIVSEGDADRESKISKTLDSSLMQSKASLRPTATIKWARWTRFSEFVQLRDALLLIYPDVPELPSKTLMRNFGGR